MHNKGYSQLNVISDAASLQTAVANMDTSAMASLLSSGERMDEATTDKAFWSVVRTVDRCESLDQPLPASVPQMLHHIFIADQEHLLNK